ncbi:transposase [Nostoc sp. DedSLP04]|uniref:transposase n=1 Tax=Nostoc sp. DedSLP04 TaxID=3075401 RepID=UPI002AD1D5E8|nr:transposase [Nostoc sp. DedSLP04]MDZ8035904.1 transposase [Nostoc sp. DedSLP04]
MKIGYKQILSLLPNNFPNWKSVYHYYRQWRKNGTWQKIHARMNSQQGADYDLPILSGERGIAQF